jgi:hypothetical protein
MDFGKFGYDGNTGFPPESVLVWSGLYNFSGAFRGGVARDDLASLNDRGEPFSEIARVIRNEWENL